MCSAFLRRKVALDILVCQVTEGSSSRSDDFTEGETQFKIVPKVRRENTVYHYSESVRMKSDDFTMPRHREPPTIPSGLCC